MLSRFNAGCDCDCCIVYRSEFCKNWYESVFERKYFGSITGNPSTMNLNGGSFDQLCVFTEEDTKIWQIRNDACGSNLSSCDTSTDPKGYTYSADHYLTPTGNLASSYLSTLMIANKFQWWMYTFWDTCDSTDGSHCWDSSASEPVSNQIIIFMFDYIDKDNWTGLQVEYKPDFNVSPGQVQRNFEARGRQSISGTVSNITDVIAIDLGLGDTKINIGIEINADQRTECGTDPFVDIDFGGVNIGFSYTSVNGDRIAVVQSSPSGVVDSLTCGSDSYTVGAGFGIYNWVHQYLDSEKTGCAEYTNDCCSCFTPSEYDVTFTGFVDDDCTVCDEFNDTFTLSFLGNQDCTRDSISTTYNCCRWRYNISAYGSINCTFYDGSAYTYVVGFSYIDLSSVEYTSGNTTWELEIIANITVYYGDNTDPWNEEGRRLCRKVWERTESAWVPKCAFDGTETWTEQSGCIQYIGDQNSSSIVTDSIWGILCQTIGTPSVEVG